MNADEVVADIRGALGLEDDEIILGVVVLAEYATLDPEADHPERRRLAVASSDEVTPWSSIGMMRFAIGPEEAAVRSTDDDA